MPDDERSSAGLGAGRQNATAAGLRSADHDREPVVSPRGLLLVGTAVLLGVLILPAATRAPVRPTAAVSTRLHAASSASRAGGTTAGTGSSAAGTSASGTSSGAAPAQGGPAPSSVHVLVANGSTVNGLGASVSSGLGGKGYAVLPPVVALTTVPSTEIWTLTPTGNAAAAQILAILGLPASAVIGPQGGPAPVSSASGADVVVVAGPDEASRFPPPSASAG